MANISYKPKGTLRTDYEANDTSLKDFHALECDWKEIFRWLMTMAGKHPFYDEEGRQQGMLSALWDDHVFTVLVEIAQKDLKQQAIAFHQSKGTVRQKEVMDGLKDKIQQWGGRLDNYLRLPSQVHAANSSAQQVAGEIKQLLEKSLPVVEKENGWFRRPVEPDSDSRAYFTMLGALVDIQKNMETYLHRVESAGDMDASLALLLVFVRHYSEIARRFNQKFERWGASYRQEVLQAKPAGAMPDHAHVIVVPKPGTELFTLPAGTRFAAGSWPDGSERFYLLDNLSYVTPVVIHSAIVLFEQNQRLYTVPVDAPLQEARELAYGWVLTSEALVLDEGKRTVTIGFVLEANDEISATEFAASVAERQKAFALEISGSEGWVGHDYTLSINYEHTLLMFQFTLEGDEEVPATCQQELHGIASSYPAVRIRANDRKSLLGWADEVRFTDVVIDLDIQDIRHFTLAGDEGELDPTLPFYPFGIMGERGAQLVVGKEELAAKSVHVISLTGTWKKLPYEGYEVLYKEYPASPRLTNDSFRVECEWQDGNRWMPCLNASLPLFHTLSDGRLSEDATFTFTLPTAQSGTGLYRLRLQAPSDGFASATYRQLYAEVMTYNSHHKEKEHKPLPQAPRIPLLADATLGYRASVSLSTAVADGTHRLYHLLENGEYVEYKVAEGHSYPLLSNRHGCSLLIALRITTDVRRVRMYMDFAYPTPLTGWQWYAPTEEGNQPSTPVSIPFDETLGLTRSGFIEVEVPLPHPANSLLWLQAVWEGQPDLTGILPARIDLNRFPVTAEKGDGTPLEAGLITALASGDERVESVLQPWSGFGGRQAETYPQLATRLSTRVATRGRAVCPADYERLVLQQFTDVEKVYCLPANIHCKEVCVVVFPAPTRKKPTLFPEWKLAEIGRYLAGQSSPFVRIRVINPTYQSISISFKAKLKSGVGNPGEAKARLIWRINNYFAEWLEEGRLPELGRSFSREALLPRLLNDEAIDAGTEEDYSLTIGGDLTPAPTVVLYPEHIQIELSYPDER
ncbi:MAG: hypothetical protein LBN24_10490 [Mediterranea sp.]|jgi:hypothetical protein|nr:hypothetical protein [Mediterranea sp.]